MEIKKLKCETQATFQRIKSFRNNLKEYAQSLDQEKESSLLQLSKNVDSLAIIHADDELGPNFAVFAESMANISAAQDEFVSLMAINLQIHIYTYSLGEQYKYGPTDALGGHFER